MLHGTQVLPCTTHHASSQAPQLDVQRRLGPGGAERCFVVCRCVSARLQYCFAITLLPPGPQVDGHLPEAFAVLGFAFYMQPMLMPLLKEMPAGPAGAKLTERAVHITLFGERVADCSMLRLQLRIVER